MSEDLAADEERLLSEGRRGRGCALAFAGAILFVLLTGAGLYVLDVQRRYVRDRALVNQVTRGAFGCVGALRGDAPEDWGLTLALEHVSRLERATRDADAPGLERQRARFRRVAEEAALGCATLSGLMLEARDTSALYFAVPAPLVRPAGDDPEGWFRRVLPPTRDGVVELTRQIEAMESALNERRAEYRLVRRLLPIHGETPPGLAGLVELAPLPPEGRSRPETRVWPFDAFVFVLRRGSLAPAACESRHPNRPAACTVEVAHTVDWSGRVGRAHRLERPEDVGWVDFAPSETGALIAVGRRAGPPGSRPAPVLGRWAPGSVRPVVSPAPYLGPREPALRPSEGGVLLTHPDGRRWVVTARDGTLTAVTVAPPSPLRRAERVEEGLELPGRGRLSLSGSLEEGWTARLSQGAGADLLVRVLDPERRVRALTGLAATADGRVVLAAQRRGEAADAILLSPSGGRTWVGGP